MKKIFYECEQCKAKALEEFPKDWIHVKSLQFAKGLFFEGKVTEMPPNVYAEYKRFYDLTFCSLSCLTKWLSSFIFGSAPNPSSSVSEI